MNQSFFFEFTTNPSVHISVILFYLLYLGIMWPLVIAMNRHTYSKRQGTESKKLALANLLLVSGDSAMFICWLLIFFGWVQQPFAPSQEGMLPIAPIGIFSTSITMSLYYYLLLRYYTYKFKLGRWTWPLIILFAFFLLRLVLHYYPGNVWLNMEEDNKSPNYSAWIRNIPLFIYGLASVLLIYAGAKDSNLKRIQRAMLCLLFSFIFYAADIFFSHLIPNRYIWITYTLKTIAYVMAAIYMWRHIKFTEPRPTTFLTDGEGSAD